MEGIDEGAVEYELTREQWEREPSLRSDSSKQRP